MIAKNDHLERHDIREFHYCIPNYSAIFSVKNKRMQIKVFSERKKRE